MFPQVVRPRFSTQAVRGQGYPNAMVNRARMPRGPAQRPVSHNQQSRVGGAGAGMPGVTGQRVNVPAGGQRKTNYRHPVSQSGAAPQPLANSGAAPAGISLPVSKTSP